MSAATLCGRRNLEDEVGIHQEGDEMSERANGRSQDDGDSQTSPKNEQQQCSEQLGGRELGLPIPEQAALHPRRILKTSLKEREGARRRRARIRCAKLGIPIPEWAALRISRGNTTQ